MMQFITMYKVVRFELSFESVDKIPVNRDHLK